MDLTDSLAEVPHPLTNVLQESPCMNTVFLIYLSTLTNLFCSRTCDLNCWISHHPMELGEGGSFSVRRDGEQEKLLLIINNSKSFSLNTYSSYK